MSSLKKFRLVSNLSFVSKLSERAAFNQIQDHLVCNNLYPVAQSAYRRNHSTDTTLLKVMNDRYSVEYHDEQAAGYYPCFAWSQCCFRYRWSQHSPCMIHIMPLFLAVLAIVIACYMAYRRIRFRSCKESRTLLHALYSKKVNFVILHHY